MSQTWRLTPSPVTLGDAALRGMIFQEGTAELLKDEVDSQRFIQIISLALFA